MSKRNRVNPVAYGIAAGIVVGLGGALVMGAANEPAPTPEPTQAVQSYTSPDNYVITVPERENPIITDDAGLVEEYVNEYGATAEPQMTDEEWDVYTESEEYAQTQPLPTITLPPCEQEDSDNCYWDAQVMGNGTGTSFISLHGTVYYPSN